MTGPEHYQFAERLTDEAERPGNATGRADLFAAAQVHVTLALAAATAMNGYDQSGSEPVDYIAWRDVCGAESE